VLRNIGQTSGGLNRERWRIGHVHREEPHGIRHEKTVL